MIFLYFAIKVGAITNAQRGAKLLKFNGLRPTITRIENPKPGDGCGFVLKIEKTEIDRALQILRKNGIRIMGVEEY